MWLDRQSLWFDETYSAYTASLSLGGATRELVSGALAVSDAPLYYWLLWAWTRVGGSSDYALRYLSVLCGVACVALLYSYLRLGLRAGFAALSAAAILAIAGFHVYYSQEARMHALVCVLALASAWFLCRAVRSGGARWWLLYALAAAAALYTFYYAALVLVALNLPALLWRKARVWRWLAANGAVLAAWVPWLWLVYPRSVDLVPARMGQLAQPRLPVFAAETAVSLAYGIPNMVQSHAIARTPAVLPAAALGVLLVGAAWRLMRRREFWTWQIVSFALTPVVALYLVALWLPAFNTRYLLAAVPGMVALLVAGWWDMVTRRRMIAGASVILLVGAGGVEVGRLYADAGLQRDDYRGAFFVIRQESLPDEALIFDGPQQFTAVDHYFADRPLPAFGLPVASRKEDEGRRLLGVWSPGDWPTTEGELGRLTASYSGLWGVYYGESQPLVEDWLSQHLLTVSSSWFSPSLNVVHYRAGPQPSGYRLPQGMRAAKQFGPLQLAQLQIDRQASGSLIGVHLLWTVTAPVSVDYSVSLQLFDRDGHRVAQQDGPPLWGALATSRWEPDRAYPDELALRLSDWALAPYILNASVYDAAQQLAGSQQHVAVLLDDRHQQQIPSHGASSAGWTVESMALQRIPNGLAVAVRGSVHRQPEADFTWFAHGLDRAGRLVGQDDHPPLARTSAWRPGDRFSEVFVLPAEPSASMLEIGAYDVSGRRAAYELADGSMADRMLVPL